MERLDTGVQVPLLSPHPSPTETLVHHGDVASAIRYRMTSPEASVMAVSFAEEDVGAKPSESHATWRLQLQISKEMSIKRGVKSPFLSKKESRGKPRMV